MGFFPRHKLQFYPCVEHEKILKTIYYSTRLQKPTVSHVTNLGLIPGTPDGTPRTLGVLLEHKDRKDRP